MTVHRNDAEALGLVDGGPIRVTTEAGSVIVELQISGQLRRRMVLIPHGFDLHYGDGFTASTSTA